MTIPDAREKLLKKLDQKMKKAIFDYHLVEEGDRILIALSGGKDSLALTELLGRKVKIYQPRFSLLSAHISMSNIPYQSNIEYLQQFAKQYNIPFIHRRTSFNPETDTRKSPCFLCSWYRRKALFDIAKEYNCNKIALGHHQDDILQTLLMNMTHQGAFGTMPPLLKMSKFEMTLIRPMCLITEKELKILSEISGYLKQKKNCPYENSSSRIQMKTVIEILEKMNSQVRSNMWNSMTHIQPDYLPSIKNK
ncbi:MULTISPECIES: tRNA 2-thiocytidine biosynthesis TtcA family protein [Bacteroidales]|jgi:hypothetical protein|uniref:tRNA 2-thiocytidine biosynthesis TtcA family protein n=1 Tax=Bacteroidales TaxID=171549 RepID=UPI0005739FF1|nr:MULTISPECIES: tRNA 2-thiocytidine biosynthesis TtcA family protein [Bacteroidales]KHM44341.1 PP-loop domain protein [Coprobacter secundus]